MPITMQSLIQEKIPYVLDLSRDDIVATGEAELSYSRLMYHVNNAAAELAREAIEVEARYLEAEYNFSITAEEVGENEVEVEIPANCHDPIALYYMSAEIGGYVEGIVWHRSPGELPPGMSTNQDYSVAGYTLTPTSIRLIRPEVRHFRLSYMRQPGKLAFGPVSSATGTTLVAGGPTAGELSVGTNFYVGDSIAAISAAGVIQIRSISGYNHLTQAFTVSSAWDTTPTTAYEWSIIHWLPEVYQEMLSYGAAMHLNQVFPAKATAAAAHYNKAMSMFQNLIKPRDRVTASKPIRARPSLFRGGV